MRRAVALFVLLVATAPNATAAQSSTPISPTVHLISAAEKKAAEKNLNRLDLPTGGVDGVWDEQSKRAFCAWRELTGRVVSRELLTYEETQALAATKSLTPTPKTRRGLNFNLQCQTAIWIDTATVPSIKIFKISSGRAGLETLPGNFKVGWVVNGWYESHRYPGAMMYRPMFFNQGQALHGSKSDGMVKAYPDSHGCVRMLHADIDFLWSQKLKVGDSVHVYGAWQG